MAQDLPPHVKAQADVAMRNAGEWTNQANATTQTLTEKQGIDSAQRSTHERDREAQREQRTYDQQKNQEPTQTP
jgi:hypothetical protein